MYDSALYQESILSPDILSFPRPARKTLPRVPQGFHVLENASPGQALSLLLVALQNTEGNALIIDALSVTNPHHIVQMCKTMGLDYREYLDRILIERPFTAYQMTSVVGELLPKWIPENNIRIVMGVGLFALLKDPDLSELYQQWGKGLVMRRLKVSTEYFGLTTLLLPQEGRTLPHFTGSWAGR